jgi:hypothetical protein
VNCIEREYQVDRIRIERQLARISDKGLEAIQFSISEKTLGLGNHDAALIDAGQMELGDRLQQKQRVTAGATSDVHGNTMIILETKFPDVIYGLLIRCADLVVCFRNLGEVLLHVLHVQHP